MHVQCTESRRICHSFDRDLFVATKLLIHIGYHKTGTSWLQTHLFPNAALGFGQVDRDLLRNSVIGKRPLEFCASECAAALAPEIEQQQRQGLCPVLSHEALSGNIHAGGYQSKEIADRLQTMFSSAKILIVIREQRAMIQSCYQQYIKIGGQSTLKEYVLPPERWSSRIPLFSLDNFKYHLLIDYYHKLFGEANVCVIPYELFFSEPRAFVETILRFSDLPVESDALNQLPFSEKSNETPPSFALEAKRRMNFLYPVNKLHRLDAKSDEDQRRIEFVDSTATLVGSLAPKSLQDQLKQQQRAWIDSVTDGMYAESNQWIATKCGIELNRFGYRMSAETRDRNGKPASVEQ